MRDHARDNDDVDGSVPHRLIGDVDLAAEGVARDRQKRSRSPASFPQCSDRSSLLGSMRSIDERTRGWLRRGSAHNFVFHRIRTVCD